MSTQNYARIGDDNVVIETWQPPEELSCLTPADIFVPWLAAEFTPCPSGVCGTWVYDPAAKTYSAPPTP